MEFDEYDYLEKTVENPGTRKEKECTNGVDDADTRKKGRSRSSKHRIDVDDDDDQEPAKRSKSYSRDNGRHKERDSSRLRSRDRDRDRDRDRERDKHRSGRERRDRDRDRSRDKEEKNAKEREDRDRSREHGDRDRGRDKKEKSDKERDEHKDRELNSDPRRDRDRHKREFGRDGERDYRKERERSHRSTLRAERHRSEYSERDGSRSHDREHKERGREVELKEQERDSRRQKDKKEEVAEPEADPERDQRTVFAYQISLKADERDVYEFFSRAGKVRDVRLIMDRNSRRSRGVGYIEFYDVMSVPMAIALSGQLLLGQPVMVKPSEAEKNLVQSTTTAAATGPYSGGARRLYVGNLHAIMTEDQLRQVFEPFGTVELVQLPLDEAGKCKGFGFVQFSRLEDARNAVNLNGQVEIAGRPIKVSAITDHNGAQDGSSNAGDLDDEEGGGLALNAHSRAALMQKLDRSGTASSVGSLAATVVNSGPTASIPGTGVVNPLVPGSIPALPGLPGGLQLPTATIPSVNTIGVPSECLLLKNMFDPKLETEPDFELDIKEDVQEECSRYGKLKHVYVDKNSAGLVYLRFENTESAVSAQRALHGRWFAGKMITATFMVPQTYESKFPESI